MYVISTGAMFSSGLFLLPGLVADETGPSMPLAYLASALLALPALFSVAELSSAMPRAGGAYLFLYRSFGPLVGTFGGFGNWISLVFKGAFALVGVSAYVGLVLEIAIEPLAVTLTVCFVVLNMIGARETTRVQAVLVALMLGVLAWFVIAGVLDRPWGDDDGAEQFSPLFADGTSGFVSAVGMVFVAYAGLTKVASMAEEIRRPERDIVRGMLLALVTAGTVYVAVTAIMVLAVPEADLADDLTPVHTAGEGFLPQPVGRWVIVAAAAAAAASTANAAVLSAARYPLAMARDQLIPSWFARVGRTGAPVRSVVLTGAAMVALILVLQSESIAKVASAFTLVVFALLNIAVLVMRRLPSEVYAPRFRSPLHPWLQVAGVLISIVLVAHEGGLALGFVLGLAIASILWWLAWGRSRSQATSALDQVVQRRAPRLRPGSGRALSDLLDSDVAPDDAEIDAMLDQARFIEVSPADTRGEAVQHAASELGDALDLPGEHVEERITREATLEAAAHLRRVALYRADLEQTIETAVAFVWVPTGELRSEIAPRRRGPQVLVIVAGPADELIRLRASLALLADRGGGDELVNGLRASADDSARRDLLLSGTHLPGRANQRDTPPAD